MSSPRYGAEPVRIMVDIETTGIQPGCRVWQIGAVVIDKELTLRDTFLDTANCALEIDQTRDSLTTLQWQQQNNSTNWHESKAALYGEEAILAHFLQWLSRIQYSELWSQGSFDFPILEAAIALYPNLPSHSWSFHQLRDSRTIFKWFNAQPSKDAKSHNALIDAHRQAELLARCRKMFLSYGVHT